MLARVALVSAVVALVACRRGEEPAPPAPLACRTLAACAVLGRCVAQGDECVASDADCRASTTCQEIGACTARNGSCEVGSDADCRSSQACRERGWCRRQDEMTCARAVTGEAGDSPR